MIICKKCGMDNQLGRVFCTSCGTKLDLTAMSSQSISSADKESWIGENWPKLVLVPSLIIVVAVAGLVLWPGRGVGKDKNPSSSSRRVEGQIASLSNLKTGQRVGPYLVSQQDLNAYLVELAKKAKVTSMTVKLSKGLVDASMMNVVAVLGSGTNKVPIGISFDAVFVPEGGKLKIVRGSVGHLPLFGPLLKIAENAFIKAVAAEPKNTNLALIEEITVDDGKMSIIVSKK